MKANSLEKYLVWHFDLSNKTISDTQMTTLLTYFEPFREAIETHLESFVGREQGPTVEFEFIPDHIYACGQVYINTVLE